MSSKRGSLALCFSCICKFAAFFHSLQDRTRLFFTSPWMSSCLNKSNIKHRIYHLSSAEAAFGRVGFDSFIFVVIDSYLRSIGFHKLTITKVHALFKIEEVIYE